MCGGIAITCPMNWPLDMSHDVAASKGEVMAGQLYLTRECYTAALNGALHV